MSDISGPELTFVFELHAQVGPPVELGDVPHGRRRIVPILGGTFSGPGIKGKVLPAERIGRLFAAMASLSSTRGTFSKRTTANSFTSRIAESGMRLRR